MMRIQEAQKHTDPTDPDPDADPNPELATCGFKISPRLKNRRGRSRLAKIGFICTLSELTCKYIFAMSTIL
jgi:hypothetical protein